MVRRTSLDFSGLRSRCGLSDLASLDTIILSFSLRDFSFFIFLFWEDLSPLLLSLESFLLMSLISTIFSGFSWLLLEMNSYFFCKCNGKDILFQNAIYSASIEDRYIIKFMLILFSE